MRYIEPHAHMVSRTTDDYVSMVASGCAAVCEPAFWAGFDRSSVDGFYDYFLQLTDYEPKRAAKFGLPHFCWLCINPKESEDIGLAKEVLSIIPVFIDPFGDKVMDHIRIHLGNIADIPFGPLDHLLQKIGEREFGLLIPVALVLPEGVQGLA